MIEPADLAPFADIEPARAAALVADAQALSVQAAPCLADQPRLSAEQKATAKAVLRQAILRWHDSGSGAFAQQTAGPFSVAYDTRSGARRTLLRPDEIRALQAVCGGMPQGVAFSIDTAPAPGELRHHSWCAVRSGRDVCTCGVVLVQANW